MLLLSELFKVKYKKHQLLFSNFKNKNNNFSEALPPYMQLICVFALLIEKLKYTIETFKKILIADEFDNVLLVIL